MGIGSVQRSGRVKSEAWDLACRVGGREGGSAHPRLLFQVEPVQCHVARAAQDGLHLRVLPLEHAQVGGIFRLHERLFPSRGHRRGVRRNSQESLACGRPPAAVGSIDRPGDLLGDAGRSLVARGVPGGFPRCCSDPDLKSWGGFFLGRGPDRKLLTKDEFSPRVSATGLRGLARVTDDIRGGGCIAGVTEGFVRVVHPLVLISPSSVRARRGYRGPLEPRVRGIKCASLQSLVVVKRHGRGDGRGRVGGTGGNSPRVPTGRREGQDADGQGYRGERREG